MWLFRGGDPQHPALVFQYHPTRSGKVPLAVLSGYRGYVQCDGYNGYDALGREKNVTLVGCWAHARRKFDKVIKARGGQKKEGTAEKAVEYIGKLYQVEKKARQIELDADDIRQLRRQESKPVLDEFKDWLEAKLPLTPPKGLLGAAIRYTLNNWERSDPLFGRRSVAPGQQPCRECHPSVCDRPEKLAVRRPSQGRGGRRLLLQHN